MSEAITMPHVVVPSVGGGAPVLVIHSWWGLTRSFVQFADRLAEAGFVAGCVDLYGGRLAATERQARAIRSAQRKEPMYRTLQRALSQLGSHPQATRSSPAVVGFSMGGHWAMWLAQHPPPPVSAVVLYYSARAGDFTNMSSPVLAHFAETDAFVTTAARRKMEDGIARRGLNYGAHDYPGTGHWFAEADHRAYETTASDLAFGRTVDFLATADRRPQQLGKG